MKTWEYVWEHCNVLSGVRKGELTAFFVKAPRTRTDLDTFLRDDCVCDVGRPRCEFHEKMFEEKVEVAK